MKCSACMKNDAYRDTGKCSACLAATCGAFDYCLDMIREELQRDDTHTPPDHLPYIEKFADRLRDAIEAHAQAMAPADRDPLERLANEIAGASGHEITVEVARAMIAKHFAPTRGSNA